jgi:hypothetical protein
MANCYAPEADDLHRRWLPRDIFTDIGIVDPEPTVAEEAAAVAAVEEIAVQLVGIIGAGRGKGKPPPHTPSPPPPPPAPAAVLAPHHLVAPVSEHSLLRRFRIGFVVLRGCLTETAACFPCCRLAVWNGRFS